ncbi:hypothetical protein MCERE19_01043 [Spirosomataceae bacterium]|jgi:hypothetical protein
MLYYIIEKLLKTQEINDQSSRDVEISNFNPDKYN